MLPNDALKHNELHHEALSEIPVHGLKQRNAHDKRVGQGGDREKSDKPIQPTSKEDSPHRQRNKNYNLRKCVGQYELGIHFVGIVLRYEVERQHRNREHRHEPVDTGALLRCEYLPPFH